MVGLTWPDGAIKRIPFATMAIYRFSAEQAWPKV
jgi:hypothetical protein